MRQDITNSREEVINVRDVFEQLGQCVEEAEKAKRTGNWEQAYEAKNELNRRIDAVEIVEGTRLGAQIAVAVKSLLERNWTGFFAAVTSIATIIVGFRKRYVKDKKDRTSKG